MARKEKIVLIGAGSLSFGLGTVGSIFACKTLEGATICLHDIDADTLELTKKACQAAIDVNNLNFELEHTVNRLDALRNATFIINSIEVAPRYPLLDLDFRVPQEFGNKQVSGENGAGREASGPSSLSMSWERIWTFIMILKMNR